MSLQPATKPSAAPGGSSDLVPASNATAIVSPFAVGAGAGAAVDIGEDEDAGKPETSSGDDEEERQARLAVLRGQPNA